MFHRLGEGRAYRKEEHRMGAGSFSLLPSLSTRVAPVSHLRPIYLKKK